MADEQPIYCGWSMFRVFTHGDRLELQETPGADVRPGDIISFVRDGKNIVHRVIETADGLIVTMGDNNPCPDAPPLLCNGVYRRVTGVTGADGVYRPVCGGEAGMAQFRRNQRRRKLRAGAGALLRVMAGAAFWRLKAARVRQFGAQKVIYCGRFPVARITSDGKIIYLAWYKRLFFKVSAEGRLNG